MINNKLKWLNCLLLLVSAVAVCARK